MLWSCLSLTLFKVVSPVKVLPLVSYRMTEREIEMNAVKENPRDKRARVVKPSVGKKEKEL